MAIGDYYWHTGSFRTQVRYKCQHCGKAVILPMGDGCFSLGERWCPSVLPETILKLFFKDYCTVENCICESCYRKLNQEKTLQDNRDYQEMVDGVDQIYALHNDIKDRLNRLIATRIEMYIQSYDPRLDDYSAAQTMPMDKNLGNPHRRKKLVKQYMCVNRELICRTIREKIRSAYLKNMAKQGYEQLLVMIDAFYEAHAHHPEKQFTQIARFTTPVNWHCRRDGNLDQSEVSMTDASSLAHLPFYRIFKTCRVMEVRFPTGFSLDAMIDKGIQESAVLKRISQRYIEMLSAHTGTSRS